MIIKVVWMDQPDQIVNRCKISFWGGQTNKRLRLSVWSRIIIVWGPIFLDTFTSIWSTSTAIFMPTNQLIYMYVCILKPTVLLYMRAYSYKFILAVEQEEKKNLAAIVYIMHVKRCTLLELGTSFCKVFILWLIFSLLFYNKIIQETISLFIEYYYDTVRIT